eukprot:45442-Prymnesium_polylepis.1
MCIERHSLLGPRLMEMDLGATARASTPSAYAGWPSSLWPLPCRPSSQRGWQVSIRKYPRDSNTHKADPSGARSGMGNWRRCAVLYDR